MVVFVAEMYVACVLPECRGKLSVSVYRRLCSGSRAEWVRVCGVHAARVPGDSAAPTRIFRNAASSLGARTQGRLDSHGGVNARVERRWDSF